MNTKLIFLLVFSTLLIFTGNAQTTDNVEVLSTWVRGENNGGIQYGRTPYDQQDFNYWIGSMVHNAGTNDQTNISLTADYGSFSSNASIPFLAADSTVSVETLETLLLSPNFYSAIHVVTSDADTIGGANFGNNSMLSEFEIMNYGWGYSAYSLDGIGVYSNPQVSAIGTGSFLGGEDGLVLATKYYIKQTNVICGIRVLLADSTVAGGEIYGSIMDSATFWQSDMTPLYANSATINNANISNGYIDLFFATGILIYPGAYYAGAELYSNGNQLNIHVLDDLTIIQPDDASGIYIPGDTTYTFGNALGIQLIMDPYCYWGLDEKEITGISVYPNPSKGEFTITNEDLLSLTIDVFSILGEKLDSKIVNEETKLDLSHLGSGIYMVKVSSHNLSMTERVIIE